MGQDSEVYILQAPLRSAHADRCAGGTGTVGKVHIHTKQLLRSDLTHWHSTVRTLPRVNRSIAESRGAARETKVSLQCAKHGSKPLCSHAQPLLSWPLARIPRCAIGATSPH